MFPNKPENLISFSFIFTRFFNGLADGFQIKRIRAQFISIGFSRENIFHFADVFLFGIEKRLFDEADKPKGYNKDSTEYAHKWILFGLLWLIGENVAFHFSQKLFIRGKGSRLKEPDILLDGSYLKVKVQREDDNFSFLRTVLE